MRNSVKRFYFLTQLARYGGVSASCAGLNLFILYLGTDVFGIHYLISLSSSFCILTPLSYWLHKRITFKDNSPISVAQVLRYTTGWLSTLLLNLGLTVLLVEVFNINYLLATILLTGLFFLGNYGLQAFWVFCRGR